MLFLHDHWILFILFSLQSVNGVQVIVKDEKKFAMLFSPIVLPCHYTTHSTQIAVVQWWYKSFCTDRTRDSFTFTETLGVHVSDVRGTSHLDCSDKSRTVRIVASAQGASVTLAEHYKERDISIINKADLRIGQLQWGDSGVYFCKVIIANDLEGINEDQVELLVQGRTGVLDDILPEFDLEIMPEWVFVGVVVLGSILFLLLVGICWCQCCPHSCCCYVRCCCCPDTCCCPKHLYEAGKMAKSSQAPQIAMYQPYYVPGIPVVPSTAPSLIDPKLIPTAVPPSVENNIVGVRSGYRLHASQGQDAMKVVYYVERDLAQFHPTKGASHPSGSLSELSSLHDADVDFRQTYRQIQRKALPPISDHGDEPRLRTASIGHGLRHSHYQSNNSLDEHDSRWNCRSEYLPRKAFDTRGRTGSLDELEEFAMSYGPHGRQRGDVREPQRDFEMAPRSRDHYTSYRDGPRCSRDADDDDWRRRDSPPSPPKRRGASERYAARQRSYDDTYLNSLLERKARGERGERGGRADNDSDTPSKGSSKKSSDCYNSRSPSNRPEEDDPLPPYSEREAERFKNERYRTADPAMRPFSYTRPAHGLAHTLQERREERDKPRKLTTHLSRDTLIV
ncbi:immunoglobulin-like domain-containing receptor 2 isoform X2 [Triplophysa rosa]|uniref:immunoglobulin-like domain-containing receptor 2 isoform X2 n=1 Tax=Triplophysa rosa TaxID=992332 RepID=UPI002218FFA7|nr:immunoglobulin-like domain-containing receptor 2 isoform X2 [Triplophysa rosa]KAI7808331.1 putative immunoglobulin-like domain-containing receptor 2 [Triplophysa rosa]